MAILALITPTFGIFQLSMNMRNRASASAAKKYPTAISSAGPTELVCLALALALVVLLIRIASLW